MRNLKLDVADIGDYSTLNKEIHNLEELVGKALPPEVRYACVFWGSHLLEVKDPDKTLKSKLYDFASWRMLNWFEAMSLLGQTSQAVSVMRDVYKWATVSYPLTEILPYLGPLDFTSHRWTPLYASI